MTAKRCRTRLGFSNAVARAGMGLTFLIAPFTQFLIDFYGWQGEHIISRLSSAFRGWLRISGWDKRIV